MQIEITREDWNGSEKDEKHFLYTETPRIVKAKIQKYLNLGIKPTIAPDKYEQFQRFCFEGDILIYPDKKNLDRANELFELLTDAIAILAFVPGGICIFGYRYSVESEIS